MGNGDRHVLAGYAVMGNCFTSYVVRHGVLVLVLVLFH